MVSYPSDVALEVIIFFSDTNTAELFYEIETFGENITLPSAVFETYPNWNFYFDEKYQQPCAASTLIYDRVTDPTGQGEAALLDLYAKPTPKRLHTLTFPGLSDEYAVPYPVDKTDEMTQPVGVDSEGKLWVEPSAGSSENANGLSSTASSLLITILRNGVYSTDQSANITALEAALASSEEETESVITQDGSVLNIVSGVMASQVGSVLTIM